MVGLRSMTVLTERPHRTQEVGGSNPPSSIESNGTTGFDGLVCRDRTPRRGEPCHRLQALCRSSGATRGAARYEHDEIEEQVGSSDIDAGSLAALDIIKTGIADRAD
jgi:hypothetical protein